MIKLLPAGLINKIAAGEVIDRPYSVIKELIENSIDAKSSQVFINIEDGGKTLIEIIDNGQGIPNDEVRLAFQRHATSKINTFDDLQFLSTMGFRGEALPSIASVSIVEVLSHYFKEKTGVFLRIEAGKETAFQEETRDNGTTIRVKNLFFNTPARKKFLKTSNTEHRYIINEINIQALAHPEIGFKLTSNKKEVFHYTPVDSLKLRILQIFGNQLDEYLYPVTYKALQGEITGYAGSPEIARKTSKIFTFLNNRYVKDKLITKAIFDVYRSMLEKNNYPIVFLYFKIDPAKVDFNVHPTKREVKFDDTVSIYSMVLSSLRKSLDKGFLKKNKTAVLSSRQSFQPNTQKKEKNMITFQDPLPLQFKEQPQKEKNKPDVSTVLQRIDQSFESEQKKNILSNLWQFHKTYIISSTNDAMIIIDQHAAAERILYEKVIRNYESADPVSQQLLFPEIVELKPDEYSIYDETKLIFEKMGFITKDFGKNSIVIESIPVYIHHWQSASTFKEILDDLMEEKEIRTQAKEKIAKYTACRTAIKAGDTLNPEQMQKIIDDLFLTEFPYTCPHGRPTLIRINLTELEKRFGRK